jgi:hypothetical protein
VEFAVRRPVVCGPVGASAQAEKGQDEQNDNDQADDVNDAVHESFPSRRGDEMRRIHR